MLEEVKVLLVDDMEGTLDSLRRQLETSDTPRFAVFAYGNPYRAFEFLLNNLGAVEFAFIDHVLVSDRPPDCSVKVPRFNSGIDLTREISRKWPHIGIVLYSCNEQITEEDEWNGLAAGAHRYVYIEPPRNLLEVATGEFICEIRELRQLKQTLENFHRAQSGTDIVQRSVKVGIDLIDRRFKVWYRNANFMEICGNTQNPNMFCCSCWHDRPWPPCRGCLVWEGLGLSKSQWQKKRGRIDRIFYSPVYPNGKRNFKYLHVWAEPVYAHGETGQPIAVVESVVDLTDSPTVEQMSLQGNLDILLQAICELTCDWLEPKRVPLSRDGRWDVEDKRPAYMRASVYRADVRRKKPILRGLRVRGEHPVNIEELTIELRKQPIYLAGHPDGTLAFPIHNLDEFVDTTEVFKMLGCSEFPLVFLLFNNKKAWIGCLSIDAQSELSSTRRLDKVDADFLQPYAEEIARVLQFKLDKPGLIGSETSRILEEVQSRIVLAKTPEDALQVVIEGIVGRRGIEMGHIRIIRRKELHLAAGKGFYYENADSVVSMDLPQSQSRRVARAGFPLIVNKRPDPRIEDSIEKMPDRLKNKMQGIQSCGLFPLGASGRVEGVLSLHSTKKNVFTGETAVLCSRLAEMASYALHDISLQTETEKRTAEIWKAAASAFAHRVGNTLPIAQRCFRTIMDARGATARIKNDAETGLESVNRALDIAKSFKKHGSRISLSLKEWLFVDLIEEIIDYCRVQHPELKIDLDYERKLFTNVKIKADLGALKDVFLSLVVDSKRFHSDYEPNIMIACALKRYFSSQNIMILYQDDGPGVGTDKKDKIFNPFYTTDDSGTGIGLTDVKNIVQSHYGSIYENGIYGKGIQFVLSLPIVMN